MIDFDDHDEVMKARDTAQEIERDRREIQNECIAFITSPHGQWEQAIFEKFEQFGRPRYTFDNVSPILEKYLGEMTQNDFNIRVSPAGMGASKETAKLMAGLVKNTESLSNATNVYNQAAMMEMIAGMACIRVEADWADPDSFDQDLFIKDIPDAINRVWPLGNYQERTWSDAPGIIIEELISYDEYEDRFGEKEHNRCQGLGAPIDATHEYYKRQGVRIAELVYKKPEKKTLYLLPDGKVLSEEDYKAINDGEIPENQEGVKKKVRESFKIMSRWFDAGGFLNKAEDIAFDYLPVVPILPGFLIAGDKPLSKGLVEGLMDWQRVRNYSGSALVEETALAPKDVIFMTFNQAAKSLKEAGQLNVAGRPIFRYDYDSQEGAPPPFKPGAYQPNIGTQNLFLTTEQGIQSSSGMYAASMGDNPALQSGVAIDKLQNASNLGMVKFVKAMEVALSHVGKILVNAYPKYYDTQREHRIINEDGTFEMINFNEHDIDGKIINDLSGQYDVVCSMGPAYKNRQEKTTETLVAFGQINPNILMRNEDILLKSIDAPGMDIAAERSRVSLMKAGEIPETQWTEEEIAQAQAAAQAAAQNPPPPDPAALVAQSQMILAQNDTVELELKAMKLQQEQQKLDFSQQKDQVGMLLDGQKQQMDMQVQMANLLKTMSETLKNIGESATEGETLEGEAKEAYDEQAQRISNVES